MTDQPSSTAGSPGAQRRRSSFAEFFNPRSAAGGSVSSSPPAAPPSAMPTPQHRRTSSITALGLSGSSPTQSSPYTAFAKQRRASISTSSGSGSPEFRNSFGDEPAVIEEDDATRAAAAPPSPSFARRVSFGAQALRDVKQGGNLGGTGGGRRPSSLYTLSENQENNVPKNGVPSKAATTAGEGFNWSEAIRDRTKRSPSFSSSANPFAPTANKPRPAGPAAEPPKDTPKPVVTPAKMKKPDHLGERMLRGDFMMD